MIDPANIIPKYFQLANILRGKIQNGEYAPQDAIPSERQLEMQYNLSRPTIRQALILLERQGYLYRVHGKGTFVSPPKLQKGMLELDQFFGRYAQSRVGTRPAHPGVRLYHTQQQDRTETGIGSLIGRQGIAHPAPSPGE